MMFKMKNLLILMVLGLGLFRMEVKADEGMWIPMLIDRLNYEDMRKMGLQLTAEEIYSVNQGSLKDAIVIFGRRDHIRSGIIVNQSPLWLWINSVGKYSRKRLSL